MSSLLRFLPSRQKIETQPSEAQTSDSSSNEDVKDPVEVSEKNPVKLDKESSSIGEVYEVQNQDPELNPGSLTLEEGTSFHLPSNVWAACNQ